MTTPSPTSSTLASRAELETRYLIALMRRDAKIFAERTAAGNRIVSKSQVKRVNPTYLGAQPAHPSLSPFEDAYSIGSLT